MEGWSIFLLVVFVFLVLGFVGWIIINQLRARRLGLPAPSFNPFAKPARSNNAAAYRPPAPASGGIGGWLTSKFQSLRNPRSSAGAFDHSTAYRGGAGQTNRRGFDPLDPDEAWDSRVGNEADHTVGAGGVGSGPYYGADTELGLRDANSGPYGGAGYGEGRSASQQRELDQRYDQVMHGGAAPKSNPFDDGAERSDLRDVSPRPARGHSRRSAFKEDM